MRKYHTPEFISIASSQVYTWTDRDWMDNQEIKIASIYLFDALEQIVCSSDGLIVSRFLFGTNSSVMGLGKRKPSLCAGMYALV